MSRFFRGDGSSSESEEDYSSDDQPQPTTQQKVAAARVYESSSDSDGQPVKRVVQSQQAKLIQEFEGLVTKIKAHIKTNEFTAVQGGT